MESFGIFVIFACIATVFCMEAVPAVQDEMLVQKQFDHTVDFIMDQFEETETEMDIIAAAAPIKFKRNAHRGEEEETCKDTISKAHCKYLKRHRACSTHKRKMGYYCSRTCEFCRPKVPQCKYTPYGCCRDEKTPAKGYYFQGCPESCMDRNTPSYCRTAHTFGFCSDKRYKNVRAGCKKTCALCRSCEDEEPLKCKRARIYGLCQKMKFSMMNSCRKTCGYCGHNDPCGAFTCPVNRQCIINSYGEPTCICSEICKAGDDLTGLVCGRNGVEYPNLCALKQASCKGPAIKVKQFGPCKPWAFMKGIQCHKIRDYRNCKASKKFGFCRIMKHRMKFMCPHTCGFCAARAAKPACHYKKYGCCMDNKTPCAGPNYQGCKHNKDGCQDKRATLCKRFRPACGEFRNRRFMKVNCANTCFYCKKSS